MLQTRLKYGVGEYRYVLGMEHGDHKGFMSKLPFSLGTMTWKAIFFVRSLPSQEIS